MEREWERRCELRKEGWKDEQIEWEQRKRICRRKGRNGIWKGIGVGKERIEHFRGEESEKRSEGERRGDFYPKGKARRG